MTNCREILFYFFKILVSHFIRLNIPSNIYYFLLCHISFCSVRFFSACPHFLSSETLFSDLSHQFLPHNRVHFIQPRHQHKFFKVTLCLRGWMFIILYYVHVIPFFGLHNTDYYNFVYVYVLCGLSLQVFIFRVLVSDLV